MTTWFAQNSSVNIDSVNQWNSAANGSGSWLTWASLGASDILVANGKTSINCNVSFTCATITTVATGGTDGGEFILPDGITVTASPVAGSTSCITFSAMSPASATIIGSPQGSVTATAHGAVNSGSGTLNITGNPLGDAGAGTSSSSAGVRNTSTGTVNVTGNPKGGSGTFGQASNGVTNSAAGTINITGNPVGGIHYGSNSGAYNSATGTINVTGNPRGRDNDGGLVGGTTPGVYNASTGTVNITGNVSGGAYGNSPGVYQVTNGLVTVNGTCIATASGTAVQNAAQGSRIIANGNALSLATGHHAFGLGIVMIHATTPLSMAFRANNAGSPGAERVMYTGGTNLGQPEVANVRSGTVFGASSEYTGTLAVPSPTLVAVGVSTDNTVGSYAPSLDATATAAAVWDAARSSHTTTGSFGATTEWGVAYNMATAPAERSTADTSPLTFSWPVAGATITGTVSIDNAAYTPVTGAFAFLRSESGKHYYTLAYNAADRPAAEGTARYLLVDGTYTRHFNLRVEGFADVSGLATQASVDDLPTNAELATALGTADDATLAAIAAEAIKTAAIKAKTDNLPSDPVGLTNLAAAHGSGSYTTATGFATVNPDNAGIAAIQAKTDNLPSDPADASDITASFGSITSTLSTIASYIDTEVAAIKAKTDNLPTDPATETTLAVLDGLVDLIKAKTDQLTFTLANQLDVSVHTVTSAGFDDIFQTYQITESYPSTGVEPTPAQAIYTIQQVFGEFTINGTTISVKKLDGTEAATYELDSATRPLSRERVT